MQGRLILMINGLSQKLWYKNSVVKIRGFVNKFVSFVMKQYWSSVELITTFQWFANIYS